MIGDDTGDNISHLNRKFSEITALYWAWKNYDKLDNPTYIGLFSYRRFLSLDAVEQVMNYDILIRKRCKSIHNENFNLMQDYIILKSFYKDELLDEYLNKHDCFFSNMFVCKKEIFFEYCEWIFPIIFELENKLEQNNNRHSRDVGYVIERLTGFFMWKKITKDGCRYMESEMFQL